ncbi:hypothetical protein CLOLEP_01758 [[Clostridium] leptum DSM 753]|uniref:Uncharacterized protein n=1 Tax=[Clostridium] leptum DSM 753 TaxID=428125 RepID=A7VT67_9FIRM|nr:hypothetical protein CLOLEP_01758 [[Clostridium] leptum DSM 753]
MFQRRVLPIKALYWASNARSSKMIQSRRQLWKPYGSL